VIIESNNRSMMQGLTRGEVDVILKDPQKMDEWLKGCQLSFFVKIYRNTDT